MRHVIDRNKQNSQQVVKIHSPARKIFGYNVEDTTKTPGTEGFVLGTFPTLSQARDFAGISQAVSVARNLPKSSYSEQQTGYKKDTRKHH